MNYKNLFISCFILLLAFQFGCTSPTPITDIPSQQLSAYYDLRDRSSYIQVTNAAPISVSIHVQIFQNDKNCNELDFNDELTPNDTVIYNLDDVKRNDGSEVPINLDDDSNGYVVITIDSDSLLTPEQSALAGIIGNFRIIDDTGYEYRANLAAQGFAPISDEVIDIPMIANFNTADGANFVDVVGYTYVQDAAIFDGEFFNTADTVTNFDNGVDFDIFVFDMNEEPLSCDRRNFACGNIMNYGVNEDYRNSKQGPLLCPGGALADPRGGYISFENGRFGSFGTFMATIDEIFEALETEEFIDFELPTFVGLIGINNGDGTGSMDYWFAASDQTLFPSQDIPDDIFP